MCCYSSCVVLSAAFVHLLTDTISAAQEGRAKALFELVCAVFLVASALGVAYGLEVGVECTPDCCSTHTHTVLRLFVCVGACHLEKVVK